MKYLLILIVIAWSDFDVNRIANINKLKNEAQTAYLNEDYASAIQKYLLLTDSLRVDDENVLLNLSNAYFKLNDSINALSSYQKLVNSPNSEIRSRAFQQLGVLADQKNKLPVALDMFKESLKANPGNEEARFNYELVKKKLQNQPQQEQENQDQENDENQDQEKENQEQEQNQDQNQDQDQEQNQDQQNQEEQQQSEEQDQQDQQDQQQGQDEQQEQQEQEQQNQPSEPEESEQSEEDQQSQPSTAEKLEEMNISQEKAKMILDAMRNSEIQYIQQNQRKAQEKNDPTKPDW